MELKHKPETKVLLLELCLQLLDQISAVRYSVRENLRQEARADYPAGSVLPVCKNKARPSLQKIFFPLRSFLHIKVAGQNLSGKN